MNSKTKTDQTAADMNIGQVEQEAMPPVTVSMKKLTAGVTTLFMGIVQMLEALEPHMAQRLVDIAVQNSSDVAGYSVENESVDSGKEGQNVEAETADSGVPATVASDGSLSAEGAAGDPEVKQERAPATVTNTTTQATTENTVPATSVTEDDITRIIVRKIKQDRSNNEKIGSILRTYGAAKVSDLPAGKYEAFLTDVSQL